MVVARRVAIGVVVVVVVAILATAVTLTIFARRGFPTTSGEIDVPGLSGTVEVLRDEHGVPTIVASTTQDLFFAQGYVHAQDRFWEMDVRRHVTAGRLSELFGASQLDTDRFVRTLGWRRIAEQELGLLDGDTVEIIEAYASGVNAWLDGRSGSQLSLEHALLPLAGARGYTPEPWTPANSVAWLKAMAWDLRANLEDELLRGRLLGVNLPEGRAWQDLFPDFPEARHPTILPGGSAVEAGTFRPPPGFAADPAAGADGAAATVADASAAAATGDDEVEVAGGAPGEDTGIAAALAAAQDALNAAPPVMAGAASGGASGVAAGGAGSNSWVLSPERSASGGALLANDPHLGPALPSLWYQVGLRCEPRGPDCPFHVVGFSFSGLPGVVIGHNDRVAWGMTNLGADVADLVVEHVDGNRFRTEDGWEPLVQRTETIRVAGGDDVEVTIRETRHGPLFSDVSEGAAEIAAGPLDPDPDADGDDHAVALRWVALDPRPTLDALPAFMLAEDWDSFRAAAARFEVPSQNLVYADVDGHIGYQAPGRIPVRRTGDGTLPLRGWTGEFGWDRTLDFEELPWAFDPPGGMLATANQPVLPDDHEPFLSADTNLGYRGARIADLLEGRDGFAPADLVELQTDDRNLNADQLVPVLLAVEIGDSDAVTSIQEVLAAWDHHDATDSAGAAAFNATWRHLLARTFHDELPEWARPSGTGRWWEVVRGLVDEPTSPWWDDATTDETETRDDILHAAMADAHAELADRFGSDPDRWRWGALHTLLLRHQTFGDSGVAPLERLFNRGPLEPSGGADVVNATGWTAYEGYEVNWVPSMRLVVDLSDLDAGRWIHLTGQSGRPFHPHYTDQAEAWRDGDTIPIAFTAQAVEAAAVDRLRLVPPGDAG